MKLEDEIKQNKPFKNEFQKLMLNISFTGSWLNGIFLNHLKPFGITPHQYNVLRILKGKHPESYCNQDITQRMIDRSSNATRIVDKLKQKGYVTRNEDSIDRRLVNIKITDSGLGLLDEIEKSMSKMITQMPFIDEEKAKLMNLWLDELRG